VFHWFATQEPKNQIQSARKAGTSGAAAMRHFLDTVSNEIREPLSAILSLSQLMESAADHPNDLTRYKECAQAITASAHLLMRTIESAMNSREAQHGELALRNDTINLAELIESCVLPYRLNAAAAGVEVLSGPHEDLPLLLADRAQTEQMLVHLLAEAVVAAWPGARVEVAARARSGAGLEVRVVTAGPERLPCAVTESEYHAASSAPEIADAGVLVRSTGFGIAKVLIEMHGGRFESVRGPNHELISLLTFPQFRVVPDDASRAPSGKRYEP
jgi:two-component system cell cycle sensor histidine kinase PleC